MPTKLPICPSCPKCGSRQFQTIRPDGFLAYRNDRQCTACDTRYSPPTPVWAALVFILVGIVLAAGCTVSVIIAVVRGSFAGLLSDLAVGLLGLASIRQGILGLREEIATAPEPLAPEPLQSEPVSIIQNVKHWAGRNRGSLICAAVAMVVLVVMVESTRRSLVENAAREALKAEQRRVGLRALTQLGGTVMGSNNGRPTAISLERSEETRRFAGQQTGTREIMDADVAVIDLFPDLERLFIKAPQITDAGLRQLSPQPQLIGFVVECPRVTEAGLRAIATMNNLEHLDLSGTRVRKLSTFELSRKPRLKSLNLSGTRISNDTASELALLQAVKELDLSATKVNDDCLKSLGKLTHLEELKLSDTQVTDLGLVALQSLSKLVLLDVTNTRVSESGRAALNQHLPNCSVILERMTIRWAR